MENNRRSFIKNMGLMGALGAVSTNKALAHSSPASERPKVLFFDVNETLLDLTNMKESVGDALGGRDDLLALWFTTMLQYL